jgi:hypothetical protein
LHHQKSKIDKNMVEQIRFQTMKHSEVSVNAYGITVKKMCASCAMKEVQNDGERVCKKMGLMVKQQFCCRHWQMSDGLKNAGLQNGGVVRQRGTQKIVIK